MEVKAPAISYDVSSVLGGARPSAFGVSADAHVWFVVEPVSGTAGASVAGSLGLPSGNKHFRVVELAQGKTVLDIEIAWPRLAPTFVDALGDRILVADSRSEELADGRWDHNTWLFDRLGVLRQELFLGDGIESLQSDGEGTIWTSHFDEGYYGNWEGVASFVAWDRGGKLRFRLQEIEGLQGDQDIASFNVASTQDTWVISWGALRHLRAGRLAAAWDLAGMGAGAFATDGQNLLVAGSWGPRLRMDRALDALAPVSMPGVGSSDRTELAEILLATLKMMGRGVQWDDDQGAGPEDFNVCWLKLHPGGSTSIEGEWPLRARDGSAIAPTMVVGRGDRLFVLADQTMHEVSLADIVTG